MANASNHPTAAEGSLLPTVHGDAALKRVPGDRAVRERLRHATAELARGLDRNGPLSRQSLEAHARTLLVELALPESYVGWTMVALASEFWRDQIEAVPHDRRLLLLPHCLRHAESCPATYDPQGLLCQDCGLCRLSELRNEAQRLGYRVLIAEGSPVVLQMILRGQADAILGAACLNSLEKAFEKILVAGVPCMAVPLLTNSCRNTTTDEDWVRQMIATPYRRDARLARSYVHLLRAATAMFEPDELARLAPRQRAADSGSPLTATEALAHDFLSRGGKHFRPFITLAAYDAMTGGQAAGEDGAAHAARVPDAVRRVAMAIEVFHKASLVHDDIEDDDPYRYGLPAIHNSHGVPMAINVGDYLIGLGYRLVAGQREALPSDAVADVLARLAEAHTRLCEGQGAELAWRQQAAPLAPLDVLAIYALKTAPAFEAALWAGLRLAGDAARFRDTAARFSRQLGVAFQVLNDLADWDDEPHNKRVAGGDALGGRPTILAAFALENLDEVGRKDLLAQFASTEPAAVRLAAVRRLYDRGGVFAQARALVDKHRGRAHALAESVDVLPLRRLLHYLADAVLP